MAKLVQQYISVQRGGPTPWQEGPSHQPSFQHKPSARPNPHLPGELHLAPSQRSLELICFYCQWAGHKASLCAIRKAILSGACPRTEDVRAVGRRQQFKNILINGKPVTALVDSDSFWTTACLRGAQKAWRSLTASAGLRMGKHPGSRTVKSLAYMRPQDSTV